MDADVRFSVGIEHGGVYRISDLSTHIILKNADLRLQPLKFGLQAAVLSPTSIWKGIKPMQGGRIYRRVGWKLERTDAGCGADAENKAS